MCNELKFCGMLRPVLLALVNILTVLIRLGSFWPNAFLIAFTNVPLT